MNHRNYFRCFAFTIGIILSGSVFSSSQQILGNLHNRTYDNPFFGFSMRFPNNWHVSKRNDMEKLSLASNNMAASKNKNLAKLLREGKLNKIYLFQVTAKPLGQPGNAMATARAYKIPKQYDVIKSGKDFLKAMKAGIKSLNQVKPTYISPVTTKTINGLKIARLVLDMKINGIKVHEKFYASMKKGYALVFMTAYTKSKYEKPLNRIVDSLKFKQ